MVQLAGQDQSNKPEADAAAGVIRGIVRVWPP